MKPKPKGPRYRNLNLHGSVIYYDRTVKGRRICFSTRTADWNEAASVRDLYEQRRGIGTGLVPAPEAPRFAEFAARYLAEATGHIAPSTMADRVSMLGLSGPLVRYFGGFKLDAIRKATLMEWWTAEMEGRGRSRNTGSNYLNALSSVLGYALDLEIIESNPVTVFRETLRRRRRTKRGRAEAESGSRVQPIEETAELAAFVDASAARGGQGHLATLLMLDAGLRIGEAEALCWPDVWFGRGASDPARALVIQASRSRGRYDGATKSGRSRRVALSQRLRTLLLEHWIAAGRPESRALLLPGFQRKAYRREHFDAVCHETGLADRTPKDLRDTFASQLLTAGVALAYVSLQLGHRDLTTTDRYYAKWTEGERYRAPLEIREGEVPADLLARIGRGAQRRHNGARGGAAG